jgi:hypothetical protein
MPDRRTTRAQQHLRTTLLAALLASGLALALTRCGGTDATSDQAEDVLAHPPRHLYTLQNAPVPGPHPTALVHLGRGFRSDGPLNLVVHFHGWDNCIANDVESGTGRCTPGGPLRLAHNLIGQLDASGANAALVAVERTFDAANSSDGRLSQAGFFRALIEELLPHVGELAGRSYDLDDLGRIVLSSHSGGYIAVGDILDRGGLTEHVSEVILLDSLYGSVPQYEAWLRGGLGTRRLAVVYTAGGGTLANSQALATRAADWLRDAGLSATLLLDERYSRDLPVTSMDAPLYFYKSSLSHDGTALYWYGRLLVHAQL